MAEGGYLEGILDFDDSEFCDSNLINNQQSSRITEVPINRKDSLGKKRSSEKEELEQVIKTGTSLLQEVVADVSHLKGTKDILEKQVEEAYAQINTANDTIESIKQNELKDLEDALETGLPAQQMTITQSSSEASMRSREIGADIVDAAKKINEMKEGTEHFIDAQKEIKEEVESLRSKIEVDLKFTKNKVTEMERKNSELSLSVQTKEKEIQKMTERLKEIQKLKLKQTEQLKELQNSWAQYDEQNDQSGKKSETGDDERSADEVLTIIKNHHENVLTEFDVMMQEAISKRQKNKAKHPKM